MLPLPWPAHHFSFRAEHDISQSRGGVPRNRTKHSHSLEPVFFHLCCISSSVFKFGTWKWEKVSLVFGAHGVADVHHGGGLPMLVPSNKKEQ